jgi:FAD/FMN-containing dehydrogenase
MDQIRPGHADYDELRSLFNSMIDRRPAVIGRCAGPGDVIEALAYARAEGLEVAVRSGGHSVAGASTNDGGLVVDVRPMKDVEVDPVARRVRVGAGCTWSDFDRATQQHGLAATGGRVSSTGVVGLTLGGGSGWLERSMGLACDNLVSVDLVTAGGRTVTASETENPELFWGLHGGGGNFGVATTLEFALRPLGPEVLAGVAFWPGDAGRDLAGFYRDWAPTLPDEVGTAMIFLTAPPEDFVPAHLVGTTVVAVGLLHAGPVGEGRDLVKPLLDRAPEIDLVGPMPYADFQCMIDDPPGLRNYWTADYHDSFPDQALDVFVKYGFERPDVSSQQLLLPWGGAVARVPEDATPLAHRDAAWISHPFALWEGAENDERAIEWARGFRRDIAAHASGGVYLNFIGNEGDERIRAAYGPEKYARLAALKAGWDPDNVFRGNQNIKPAA